MPDYRVIKENLLKMETYIVEKAKQVGSKQFDATKQEMAGGSGLALATAWKALNQMEASGIISIKRHRTKSLPHHYTYHGDIEKFDKTMENRSQIEYLQRLVASQQVQINSLKEENSQLRGRIG